MPLSHCIILERDGDCVKIILCMDVPPAQLLRITKITKEGLACSAGGFRWDERVDIPFGCSGRHLELEKQWRVGAR